MANNMNTSLVCLLLIFSLTLVMAEEDLTGTTLLQMAGKEKMTSMRVFVHGLLIGENATSVIIAQAATSNVSATSFGTLFMLDEELREGAEPSSKLIGRAQGLEGSSGQKELTLILAISFVFTEGKYNGSSLSILARNPLLEPVREVPIVGGTGFFRFARGFALTKTTIVFIASTGVSIAEYNLTVIHY